MRCPFIFALLFVSTQLSALDVNAQQPNSGQWTRPVRFSQFPAASNYPQQQYPQQQYPQQQYPQQQYPQQQYPQQQTFPQDSETMYFDGMMIDQPNYLDNNCVTPDSGPSMPNNRVNEGNWSSPSGRVSNSGQYPFVIGNIFGLSSDECCDEWAGHCRCLELTNLRSNCECTNPYRTKTPVPEHSLDSTNTSGDGFHRTTSRKTVSEYFQPRNYR